MSVSFQTLRNEISSRYLDIKGCGANREGGGGFQAGNTCSKGGTSSTGPLTEEERTVATAKLDKLAKLDEPNYEAVFGKTNVVDAGDVFTGSSPVHFIFGVSDMDSKRFGKETTVDLASLTAGQAHIPREGLRSYIKEMPSGNSRIPEVVKLKGDEKNRTVIMSGHTRLGAQVLAGRSSAKVILYTLDRSTGKLVKNE